MPNPVPEKRVGLALLLIGGFSLLLYAINSYATRSTDLFACVAILVLLGLGWYLRQRFRTWGLPPPPPKAPPKPAGPKPAAPAPRGGLPMPFGKRKGPAPPAKPALPPPGPPAGAKPKGPPGPGKK